MRGCFRRRNQKPSQYARSLPLAALRIARLSGFLTLSQVAADSFSIPSLDGAKRAEQAAVEFETRYAVFDRLSGGPDAAAAQSEISTARLRRIALKHGRYTSEALARVGQCF